MTESKKIGMLHPDYGDLYSREEWGDRESDTCCPADLEKYYPDIPMSERTEEHTHVMCFKKWHERYELSHSLYWSAFEEKEKK